MVQGKPVQDSQLLARLLDTHNSDVKGAFPTLPSSITAYKAPPPTGSEWTWQTRDEVSVVVVVVAVRSRRALSPSFLVCDDCRISVWLALLAVMGSG